MSAKCVFGGKKGLAAALLAAAMSLPLIFGCSSGGEDGPNGEGDSGNGEYSETKNYKLKYITGDVSSAKKVKDILDKLKFEYTYCETVYNKNGEQISDTEKTDSVNYDIAKTRNNAFTFKIDGKEVGSDDSVSSENEKISFEIYSGNVSHSIPDISNENYINPENGKMSKNIEQLLKDYMTTSIYTAVSGEVAPAKTITLSAQTIKDAGTIFPVLQNIAAEPRTEGEFKDKKPSDITQTNNDLNKALVALSKDYITIVQSGEKYTLTIKDINVKGSDLYDLAKIEIVNSNSKGNFTDATFTGSNITIDKINAARGNSLPTLKDIVVVSIGDSLKEMKAIYELYKPYDVAGCLDKIDIRVE